MSKDPKRTVDTCTRRDCLQFGIEQSIDNFRILNKIKGYRNSWCKECERFLDRRRRVPSSRKREILELLHRGLKKCVNIKCAQYGMAQPIANFSWNNKIKNQFQSRCKQCIKHQHNSPNIKSIQRKSNSIYQKKRRREDIQFKIAGNLRSRLFSAISGQYKSGSAVRDLGCTISELKQYLESKFQPGMSWNNYGNKSNQWNIDHVISLSSVDLTDREQLLNVCHWTNLQPMWHIDNIKKGDR